MEAGKLRECGRQQGPETGFLRAVHGLKQPPKEGEGPLEAAASVEEFQSDNGVFMGKQSVGKCTACLLTQLSFPRQEREESISNGHTCLPLIITLLSFHLEGAIMALWIERERTRDLLS